MKLRDLMAQNNPYHPEYKIPKISGWKDILKYMMARQKSVFGGTILEQEGLSYKILEVNIKRLLSEYSEEQVVWGICAAISVCDHAFSTKMIKELVCQRYDQNKS